MFNLFMICFKYFMSHVSSVTLFYLYYFRKTSKRIIVYKAVLNSEQFHWVVIALFNHHFLVSATNRMPAVTVKFKFRHFCLDDYVICVSSTIKPEKTTYRNAHASIRWNGMTTNLLSWYVSIDFISRGNILNNKGNLPYDPQTITSATKHTISY